MWTNLYGRPLTGPVVTCYGCVACQKVHRQGIDDEYDAHLHRQSKHGVYERAPLDMGERFAVEYLALQAAEASK